MLTLQAIVREQNCVLLETIHTLCMDGVLSLIPTNPSRNSS